MDSNGPSAFKLVLIPAILTLVVTILRLYGELQGWDENLFYRGAPGAEDAKPGWVGISWLLLIFGFWFGMRLRRGTGEPESVLPVVIKLVIAIAIMAGGFVGLTAAGLVTMPSAENPDVESSGLPFLLGLLALSMVITYVAWPRLARVLILYGLLARIPIVIVTWISIQNEWDVHYVKLPAGQPAMEGMELFTFLSLPQMTFWIGVTMMFGGLTACLGAALSKKQG